LYATGAMESLSQIILNTMQRNNGFVFGRLKCTRISFSFVIEMKLQYSSSTAFFNNCLLSNGGLFCEKKSARAGGKLANEYAVQDSGVF